MEKPGIQSSWWQSSSCARPHGRRLVADEVGEGALDRLAVDVAAAGGGEDRHVGAQTVEDAGPVTGRVLEQQGALGRVEPVEERTAVAPGAVADHRGQQVLVAASLSEVDM